MWRVKDNFEEAIKMLNLSTDVVVGLDDETNQKLYFDFLNHFVIGGDRRWWWEAFNAPFSFPRYDVPLDHLNEIIPDMKKKVWIMIEDDQRPFYPIYDIQASYIQLALGECFGFEYYVIDKNLDWLICANHHGHLIGIGDRLKEHNKSIIVKKV